MIKKMICGLVLGTSLIISSVYAHTMIDTLPYQTSTNTSFNLQVSSYDTTYSSYDSSYQSYRLAPLPSACGLTGTALTIYTNAFNTAQTYVFKCGDDMANYHTANTTAYGFYTTAGIDIEDLDWNDAWLALNSCNFWIDGGACGNMEQCNMSFSTHATFLGMQIMIMKTYFPCI